MEERSPPPVLKQTVWYWVYLSAMDTATELRTLNHTHMYTYSHAKAFL